MRALSPKELDDLSEQVRRNLSTIEEFNRAKVVACYVAKADEVRTEEILRSAIRKGIKVLVPLTDSGGGRLFFSELRDYDSELAPGTFGVMEPKPEFLRPVPLEGAEVALVPLVAWDERGYRLGHGKGYYDRALVPLTKTATIGLALEAQRVERIPERPSDVPLQSIVTERRVLRFGRTRRPAPS